MPQKDMMIDEKQRMNHDGELWKRKKKNFIEKIQTFLRIRICFRMTRFV